eukprot:TRINITY_DN1496_c1_g2_i1.p1 TRINITY_DN1496_c1_g2~~TRINITY_DN1496_c1_g2_i1.p1  ORF type:complete len:704 (+),score=165.92 TRINITY_DN1496_c1_g2_i1:369-2480(+)
MFASTSNHSTTTTTTPSPLPQPPPTSLKEGRRSEWDPNLSHLLYRLYGRDIKRDQLIFVRDGQVFLRAPRRREENNEGDDISTSPSRNSGDLPARTSPTSHPYACTFCEFVGTNDWTLKSHFRVCRRAKSAGKKKEFPRRRPSVDMHLNSLIRRLPLHILSGLMKTRRITHSTLHAMHLYSSLFLYARHKHDESLSHTLRTGTARDGGDDSSPYNSTSSSSSSSSTSYVAELCDMLMMLVAVGMDALTVPAPDPSQGEQQQQPHTSRAIVFVTLGLVWQVMEFMVRSELVVTKPPPLQIWLKGEAAGLFEPNRRTPLFDPSIGCVDPSVPFFRGEPQSKEPTNNSIPPVSVGDEGVLAPRSPIAVASVDDVTPVHTDMDDGGSESGVHVVANGIVVPNSGGAKDDDGKDDDDDAVMDGNDEPTFLANGWDVSSDEESEDMEGHQGATTTTSSTAASMAIAIPAETSTISVITTEPTVAPPLPSVFAPAGTNHTSVNHRSARSTPQQTLPDRRNDSNIDPRAGRLVSSSSTSTTVPSASSSAPSSTSSPFASSSPFLAILLTHPMFEMLPTALVDYSTSVLMTHFKKVHQRRPTDTVMMLKDMGLVGTSCLRVALDALFVLSFSDRFVTKLLEFSVTSSDDSDRGPMVAYLLTYLVETIGVKVCCHPTSHPYTTPPPHTHTRSSNDQNLYSLLLDAYLRYHSRR